MISRERQELIDEMQTNMKRVRRGVMSGTEQRRRHREIKDLIDQNDYYYYKRYGKKIKT